MDETQVHKHVHRFYRQFERRTLRLGAWCGSFCYDKVVWSRIAARHGREFVRHVIPAVAKPARTLWNDFIAFLFCCLAVPFGFRTVHLALDYGRAAPPERLKYLLLSSMLGIVTLVLLAFGLSSFLRARKIARS